MHEMSMFWTLSKAYQHFLKNNMIGLKQIVKETKKMAVNL